MKTVFVDKTGEVLKRRDYDVPLDVFNEFLWAGKKVKIKEVKYEVSTDSKIVILDEDLTPE